MKLADVRRLLEPIMLRVKHVLGRGVVNIVDDTKREQVLQISLLADETLDGVERPQPYGFTSHPHPGAEAYAAFHGGIRAHGIVFCVGDRRYRLTGLEQGEVALHDDLGNKVWLKRTGILLEGVVRVDVVAPIIRHEAETRIELAAPIISIEGNLEAGSASGGSSIEMDDSHITVTSPAIDFEEA